MSTISFPLAMPPDLLQEVRAAARDTGLSQQDVVRQSLKAGLPKVREQFQDKSRVTNVEPLSKREWRKIYSEPDELARISGKQLMDFQSQKEPS